MALLKAALAFWGCLAASWAQPAYTAAWASPGSPSETAERDVIASAGRSKARESSPWSFLIGGSCAASALEVILVASSLAWERRARSGPKRTARQARACPWSALGAGSSGTLAAACSKSVAAWL